MEKGVFNNGVMDGADVPAQGNLSGPMAEDNNATVDLSKVTVRKPNKSRPKDVTGDVKSKHDFIEGVFGFSAKSTSDISLFLRDFDEGKYQIWKTLDSKTRSQVNEALTGLFEAFSLDMKAFATNSVVSGKVTTPDVNVDANTQPCPTSTYSSLVDEPVCEGVDAGLAKDVSANAITTSPKLCDKGIVSGVANKSFASVMGAQPVRQVVTLSELRNDEVVEGAAVTLPLAAVDEVNARFANTLFGYFIGKRLAYKLVEKYVTNTWAKFGLKRMQLHGDFFLFQFDTKAGMERVLETGPWMIRRVPLILNIWSPNVDLMKEEVKTAPVWIKLHHVPIVAFTEVGLSLITTQIGKPIMLDSYTSNMCASSWGRSSYARALIEVSADKELMDSMVIAIPKGKDKGHTLAKVEIEYEWRPPRCSTCLLFDHVTAKCPKLPNEVITTGVVLNIVGADQNTKPCDVANDGFQVVKTKRNKKKKHIKQVDGVVLNKPPLQLYYRRVDRGDSSKLSGSNGTSTSNVGTQSTFTSAKSKVPLENSFSALDAKDDCERQHTKQALEVLNESDSEVDEVISFDDRGGSLKST